MVIAGRLLSNSWHDFSIRVGGTDAQIAEPRALYNAWQALACDYGYSCDASNSRVLSACAFGRAVERRPKEHERARQVG